MSRVTSKKKSIYKYFKILESFFYIEICFDTKLKGVFFRNGMFNIYIYISTILNCSIELLPITMN